MAFIARCESIPAEKIEYAYQHVPMRSSKLTSIAQVRSALQAVWNSGVDSVHSVETHATFLAGFWDSLSELRVELRPSETLVRSQLRRASLATSAIGIGAYFAVAAEIFRNVSAWNADGAELLRNSVLARSVDPEVTLERHAAATLHARQKEVGMRRLPASDDDPSRRSLIKSGYVLADSAMTFESSTKGPIEFDPPGPMAASRAASESQREDHLELAAALVRASAGTRDFFDLAAPWWRVGHCVSVNEDAGIPVFSQAKGSQPKQWAGALAIRLLQRLT